MRAIAEKLLPSAVLAFGLSYAALAAAADCEPDQCNWVYNHCMASVGEESVCVARREQCERLCGFGR